MLIYLDNSATTRPYKEVVECMSKIHENDYGNPSSRHSKGLDAERLLKESRTVLADLFSAKNEEIIFTSGGTEANNLAILGTVINKKDNMNHIVTSLVEHPSVLRCFHMLENSGFDVTYLPVDKKGLINLEALKQAINKKTALVSIIHVQNEIGTIQPLKEIGSIIKNNNPLTLFHVDAVQSFCRLPMEVKEWQADLVTCSAHKVYGPKGAGCLWVKNSGRLKPLFHGGPQEYNMRPGTENTAAIAGFSLAVKITGENMHDKMSKLKEMKTLFYELITSCNHDLFLNGPGLNESASHILNISFPPAKAEVMMHLLDQKGILVSSGSACHSKNPEPSHVLKALGITGDRLLSSLRFSFPDSITREEISIAARATVEMLDEYFSFTG